MGSLERRLERLEALERRVRLPEVVRRYYDALVRMSDWELVLILRNAKRLIEESKQIPGRDVTLFAERLEGEERLAWEAYVASGTYAAELEIVDALDTFPQGERVLRELMEDEFERIDFRTRLRSLPIT